MLGSSLFQIRFSSFVEFFNETPDQIQYISMATPMVIPECSVRGGSDQLLLRYAN